MHVPYVYKWTHLPSLGWYVGSRTAQGCYPNDGYICSSNNLKPIIQANPQDWAKSIVATGTREEMLNLELTILRVTQAHLDNRSFNGGLGYPTLANVPKKSSLLKKQKTIAESPLVTCLGCKKTGKLVTMKPQHFENCGKRKGRPALNKGVSPPKEVCTVCGITASVANLTRWHNENCGKIEYTPVNKGKAEPIVECPWCHTTGGRTGMHSSHFDRCKLKPGQLYIRPDKRRSNG